MVLNIEGMHRQKLSKINFFPKGSDNLSLELSVRKLNCRNMELIKSERNHLCAVLTRIISIICHLAEQNLAFRLMFLTLNKCQLFCVVWLARHLFQ